MVVLIVLQFAVPLLLVAWLGIGPARNLVGYSIQAFGTAACAFAIGLVGIWAFPPWWTPYAIGYLLLIATAVGWWRRRPFARVLPSSLGAWISAAVFFALGALMSIQAALALAGRAPPRDRLINLALPLESGTYLIVNGGNDPSINAHMSTLNPTIPRLRAVRGQSYGVDIVQIDKFGLRATGLRPSEPRAYHVYGARVLAPCTGEIISAVDGLPDMQVPRTDRVNLAGNHVTLRCHDAEILLAHLKTGSLKVIDGSRVNVGDLIAAVGNSGNSDEPHLHIHAQMPGTITSPISGKPLPMLFNGRYLVRNDRLVVP